MNINQKSMYLIIRLVAEGAGVIKAIADLAKRVQAGEIITVKDIAKGREAIDASLVEWEASKKKTKKTFSTSTDVTNG